MSINDFVFEKDGKIYLDIPKVVKEADHYRKNHKKNGCTMSRYQAIIKLVGERQADQVMRTLEVHSWDFQDMSNPLG